MRRQNPPQSSLDQALALEKYLNPVPIAVAYALCAIAWFAVVALLFGVLAYDYILTATAATTVIFGLAAVAPAVAAFLAFSRRPGDPLSLSIRSLVDSRRQPICVAADRSSFQVLLMTGETLCVNLAFQYPARHHAPEVRQQVNICVRAALDRVCSGHSEAPLDRDVLDAVDGALEVVAAEFQIPVLYAELRDMHKIRDAYSKLDDLTPSEYLGVSTGTLG